MKIGIANVNNGFLTYARVQVLQRVTSLYICTRSRPKIDPVFTPILPLYGENGISYYERSRGRETVISSGFINLPIDFMPKKFQTHSLMHNGRMLDLVPPHNTPPRYVPIFFKILNFFCDWDVRSLWIGRRLPRRAIKTEQIFEK